MIVVLLHTVLVLAAADSASNPAPPPPAVSSPAPAGHSLTDSVTVLPEVRVTRERPVTDARRRAPSGFVTELEPGAATRAFESLPELLGEAAGVHVTQYGGLGAFSTVSVRGAPPGQVAIYLDGTPLNSASKGIVNLADLPFGPIERVEVYRGSGPLGFGGASPGGAINLVSLSQPGAYEARVTRGSFDTWEARGSAGLGSEKLALVLHGGWQGSDGDFQFDDNNGTPFNTADDSVSTRVNNRFDAANALAALTWRPGARWQLAAREHFFHKAQGVPGLGAVPAYHPRLALERSLTQLEAGREASAWWPRVALRGALERDRSRFRDTQGELRPGRTDQNNRFGSESAALETAWPGEARWATLEGSATLRAERALLTDVADGRPDPPQSDRVTRGGSAGVALLPFGDVLLLRAAQRWDVIDDHLHSNGFGTTIRTSNVTHEVVTPQLGARLRPMRALELRGNWTRAERAPDFSELFGDEGSVMGNPTLRPERGENWDAGGRLDASGFGFAGFVEAAHFESDTHDLIVYLKNFASTVKAANVSRAAITGDELTARIVAPLGFTASGAITWMSAIDQGAVPAWHGKQLPLRPAHQSSARLEWRHARVALASDLEYLSQNYLDPYNRQPVPARTLIGAALELAPVEGLALTVEGKNLGDVHAFDVGGYPLPGRTLFVSFAYRLGPAGHAQP